ncbi:MAG TPA: GAF domain-containing protein [Casimicrobiaceae bacterium]|nr:GAF domain-containing protein [Casimicrobiaceae bacterium]
MASSPGDVHAVLYAVAQRAARLCDAIFAQVLLVEDDVLRPTAAYWADSVLSERYDRPGEVKRLWPLKRSSVSGRAVLDCATIHHADALPLMEAEYSDGREKQQELGYRAVLAVPLMRQSRASGAIFTFRLEPRPFSPDQIALVETFARQAAIAIENARLFNETKEALEQQTATSEILRVISRSPTDVQPVFDTIVRSAVRLCGADHSVAARFDGELLYPLAHYGFSPEALEMLLRTFPMRPSRENMLGRAVLKKDVDNLPDMLADPDYSREFAIAGGWRSGLSVPMLRDGHLIGAIAVSRKETGAFPDQLVTLLKTFADQAVIAIENVRLFTELEKRNRDLGEALEQQTATSEILSVISQSPTDVQPVFDTIAGAALKLCHVGSATVVTFDGELIHARAVAAVTAEGADAVRNLFPRPPSQDVTASRAILTNAIVMIPDVLEDPHFIFKSAAVAGGFRATLSVPLIRENKPIGAITLGRPERGPFADTQIALLKTFADQAVIAIENVRLFKELEARNRDLGESLEQQTATSDILKLISRSPTDEQPVFDAIVLSASRLFGRRARIRLVEGQSLRLRATSDGDTVQDLPEGVVPIDDGSVVGRVALERKPMQVRDTRGLDAPAFARAFHERIGYRSIAAAPLIRDHAVVGVIAVISAEPDALADKEMVLLQTFADQAVIAIENVRLFKELEARTRELTRSVGELKALSEVGQAVSSTLDLETVLRTIVSRATQLAGMDGGSIWEYDDAREEFHLHATNRLPDELIEVLRATPIRKGEGALGRLAMTAEPVEIQDFADERTYKSRLRETLIRSGYRSVVAVPLLREDRLLGALAVNRKSPGGFDPQIVELLKTFATQSALAIQNARLFREIEDKSRQLEIASQHKSEFLANMSHELRTPLNAILGFSEVLAERMFGEINDKQAEYLSDILESGRHLLALINDILDLSKIEAGRMELEPTDFDLPSAIENTLILVRERAQRRGIRLGRTVDGHLGKIHADERKVKQVLLNLLSNALKFTPEGGQIDVRADVRDGVAEISVTDTGVGIAPEDQEAVFEEFRQVGTASKKAEGTGLGLAISRKFIELHGGKIWVTSQVGKGSTFTFTLPLHH